MAQAIKQNAGDVFLHLYAEEYAALLSLLNELENPDKLFEICEREKLEITRHQCTRISKLWAQLVQGKLGD